MKRFDLSCRMITKVAYRLRSGSIEIYLALLGLVTSRPEGILKFGLCSLMVFEPSSWKELNHSFPRDQTVFSLQETVSRNQIVESAHEISERTGFIQPKL